MDLSARFDRSFDRNVQHNEVEFFTTFYRIFTSKSDEIKRSFANTDMDKQKKMLKESLLHLVAFSLTKQITAPIEEMAKAHANLGISKELYDTWMDSLIESLVERDSEFSNSDAMAWRVIISPGLELMKSYAKAS